MYLFSSNEPRRVLAPIEHFFIYEKMLSHLLIDKKKCFLPREAASWRLRKAFFPSRFADVEGSVVLSLFVPVLYRNIFMNDLEMTLTLKFCSGVYLSHRNIQKSHWVHLSTTYGLLAMKKNLKMPSGHLGMTLTLK